MLLAQYHDPDWGKPGREATEFEYWVRHYGLAVPATVTAPGPYRTDSDPHPVIRVDLNRCILCTRCVRACHELQARHVWGVAGRGNASHIVAGAGGTMLEGRCESCGACVALCPTSALSDRGAEPRHAPDETVTTVCAYCGVGCALDLAVVKGRIAHVRSNPYAPVNGSHLCAKGRYGHHFVHHADRLAVPRVRRDLLEGRARRPGGDRGEWVDTDWDTALAVVAAKVVAVTRESGPDAIGFLASAKCTNEENYLVQKLARQVIGTHNVDHCARLCHSSSVAGLTMALGSGAMSNTMRDVAEQARALFVIGANPTEQHPVFGAMLRRAVERRGAKLVVADPRAIDLCEHATLHLRHRPGTDVALLNGLMHIIVANDWHDREFIDGRTEGFDALVRLLDRYSPKRVARLTGVPLAALGDAARILALERPMAAIWAMGITQHTTGVANVLSLANLQLLLGNLGVPGGGVNPLRGQNNVQGASDMGALPDVLPGYQRIDDPAVRRKFADAWALRAPGVRTGASFGDRPGLTVTELIDAAGAGRIRALCILGENPAVTDPDVNRVKAALASAQLVVLQELFPSETSRYADVLLPGTSWAEKEGTFTNTERRVQRVRAGIDPLGEARPDWAVIAELARRVLALERRTPAGPAAAWDYASPREVFDEMASLTPAYAGIGYARLEGGETLHWPVPHPEHPGTPILHADRFPRGRGRFHACEHAPPRERPDDAFPFLLTTGRVLYHWHAGEMTRRSPGLAQLCPVPEVEIHPADARRLGLRAGGAVRLLSRRGESRARAALTVRVPEGVVFANFHFPGEANANNLTLAALDPIAKIPEYKACAVRVEPIRMTR